MAEWNLLVQRQCTWGRRTGEAVVRNICLAAVGIRLLYLTALVSSSKDLRFLAFWCHENWDPPCGTVTFEKKLL